MLHAPILNFAAEQRATLILAQYWNELRGDEDLPREDQLEPDRLIGIWERCFLVQVRDIEKVKDFNYSYFGPDLQQAYHDGRLSAGNGHIVEPDATALEKVYKNVMDERGPLIEEETFHDKHGRSVSYRQILMPFGDENGVIHSILGGTWFRLD